MRWPRIIRMLLPLAILLTACWSAAASDTSRFQQANEAYSQGDFPGAITIYEELAATDGVSASLYYNLANSYAQAGRIGKAVLNYERALRLAPGNADIAGNLQLVRSANGLFSQEQTLTEKLLHLLSMNQWVGLGVTALVLLTLVLAGSLIKKLSSRMLILHGLGCGLVMGVAAVAVVKMDHEYSGSVVISETRLLISPFAGAASAGAIQEGRLVYGSKHHHGYLYVEDETGRKGWIDETTFESVIPGQASGR